MESNIHSKTIVTKGVLAEQERVWLRLADILDKNTLSKIKYDELFNK